MLRPSLSNIASSSVEFFEWFPVVEIRGEVALIVIEAAVCDHNRRSRFLRPLVSQHLYLRLAVTVK